MRTPKRGSSTVVGVILFVAVAVAATTGALAFRMPSTNGRFDARAVPDPSVAAQPSPVSLRSLSATPPADWSAFFKQHGPAWDVYLDARTNTPTLVQGQGIPFIPGSGNTLQSATPTTVASLETALRAFLKDNVALLKAADAELVLNEKSSGKVTPDLWQVVFDRVVSGLPVTGDRYEFFIGHGNLIAFGASRWTPISTDATPKVDADAAQAAVRKYAGLTLADEVKLDEPGHLELLPVSAGTGYGTALAWRVALHVVGEPGTWEALVDAHTGTVLAFYDANRYATAKGGVLPISNDGECPTGCEQPGYPMPYADISLNGGTPGPASPMGTFTCTPGTTATTTLAGPYVGVWDQCGPTSESVSCDNDLDLQTSPGTDCSVPPGASPGNTRSARSSYYHLNRIKEHARAWLPTNGWLNEQLLDIVNIPSACNGFWNPYDQDVNFYRSGAIGSTLCRNTGEIAAIFLHEWGHGLDQNDGGGAEPAGEAYADITALMLTHSSCSGRGFFLPGGNGYGGDNCTGYGNACLACSGIRELNWDKRANHTPSTPDNWMSYCPSGSGVCGGEVHCESYIEGETFWDLATRDLPASGVDQQTAWGLVDRMWFTSRNGSGGSAFNCVSQPSQRSCSTSSWFSRIRTVDDDDGNLANGTPHAAAIFAAFDRHGIPCGAASDASNQSTTSCPTLSAPVLTATGIDHAVQLSWTAVPGAAAYHVFRNDMGCDWGGNLIATVSGTTYLDANMPNVFTVYYTVQAVGSNNSCLGTLAACTSALPGVAHAALVSNTYVADTCASGGAGNGDLIYDPNEQLAFNLTVRNDGSSSLTNVVATITSTTPGVTILNGTYNYGDIPLGVVLTSSDPPFAVVAPHDAACLSTIDYTVTLTANEGSWPFTFSQTIGKVTGDPPIALFAESFDGASFPPSGWAQVDVAGTAGNWARATNTVHPAGGGTHSGAGLAYFNAYSSISGSKTRLYRTTGTAIPAGSYGADVSFWMYHDPGFAAYNDRVQVQVSTDGVKWTDVGAAVSRHDGTTGWAQHTVSLNAFVGQTVQLAFLGISSYGNDCHIDDVQFTYTPTGCTMNACGEAPSADLTVSETATPATVPVQGDITYTMVVTNNGPTTASFPRVSTAVPAHTTFRYLSRDAEWNCTTPDEGGTGPVNCYAPSLDAGASATLLMVVRVDYCAGNGTVIGQSVSVGGGTLDPTATNNGATASTTVADDGVCSDFSSYTTSDRCVGFTCTGIPVEAAPGTNSANGQAWSDRNTMTWPGMPGVASFRLYRGVPSNLVHLVDTGADSCLRYEGAATSASVPEVPPAGSMYWYLVTGVNGTLEGPAGNATSGPRTVNSTGACF